ncbi:MAG: glycosyltransferase family 39 protein [Chloroflexi bacterium]|nr:glycosyltransferase family 39 protein [Chloroflexota bacterium]MCL5025338.1 glycosyltransferase family 39 protein [Chloroflexota bacterium]
MALAVVLVVGAFLRFFRLDALPPGLHYDEAAYGMLATDMLHSGQPQIFFRAYAAREPFFVYLVAASITALGHTPLALHLVAASVSFLTVVFTYLFARLAFGRWAALAGSGLLAVSYWHVHTGRLAFRAITVPLMMALTAWLLWLAFQRRQWRWYVLAGLSGGLTFYTYIPARFLAVLVPAFVLAQLLLNREWLNAHWRGLLVSSLVAAAVAVPLGVHYLQFPDDFFVRFDQSSVFTAGGSSAVSSLATSFVNTLGMFNLHGDWSFKYNLPGRPVFDWFTSALFYLGIVVALRKARRPEHSFTLLWLIVMLLPGALTIESPHFLRTLGAAPPAHLLPAIGLIAAFEPARRRWPVARYAVAGVAVAWLAWTGANTYRSYFDDWGRTTQAFYAMEGDVAAAAGYVNILPPGETVYFAAEHYRHPSVAFLAGPAFERLKWFDGREVLPLKPGALYVFPHLATPPEIERYFPPATRVAEGQGPEGEPSFAAYRLPAGEPPLSISMQHALSANMGGVVQLLGYGLANQPQPGDNLDVVLYWEVLERPAQTLGFSLQLVDEKGRRWGQRDPGSYLSEEWEPGETLVSWLRVPLDPTAPPGKYHLEIDLYDKKTLKAMPILDPAGKPQAARARSVAIEVPRRKEPLPASELPIRHRMEEPLAGGIGLLGYDQRPDTLRPGDKLFATLFWQAAQAPDRDYEALLQVVGEDGRAWQEAAGVPVDGTYPTSRWSAGEVVRDERELTIGGRLPPGKYQLHALLREGRSGAPASAAVALGTFTLDGRERRFESPPVGHIRRAELGEVAGLLGCDLATDRLVAGQKVDLTLYWQARDETDVSYKVFVHLLDADNKIWGQQDAIPGNGSLPTTSWLSGEVITDHYQFALDPAAPPGRYLLEVGMYDPATGKRVPVRNEEGDRVPLAEVDVTR